MFWMRKKENNFPIHTLIWRLEQLTDDSQEMSKLICASKIKIIYVMVNHLCDFQQYGILRSVDSDEPVQPPLSIETPNVVGSVP